MSDSSPANLHFLRQLNEVITKNLANEHFGVTELAEAMNMSRSNLLRKVKK
jgi:transcriptional regulator with PAS, ATPase and Fis domain